MSAGVATLHKADGAESMTAYVAVYVNVPILLDKVLNTECQVSIKLNVWGVLSICAHRHVSPRIQCSLQACDGLATSHHTASLPDTACACRHEVLEHQLQGLNLSEEQKLAARQSHQQKEKAYTRHYRRAMSVNDFEPLTIVGRGAFGEVRIVREKATGKLFAMKKLRKTATVQKNQVQHRPHANASSLDDREKTAC